MKPRLPPAALLTLALLTTLTTASIGDRLPEFKSCVSVCEATNCAPTSTSQPQIPLHRRLLLWSCPAECDHACQHIITLQRLARDPPYLHPVVQFHGKWPFHRFIGMQEPFSVLFSLLNLLAHRWGLRRMRDHLPAAHGMQSYYKAFGLVGQASWVFSMVFHARDFSLTEKLDYFAAGANVLAGTYCAVVRAFGLYKDTSPRKASARRAWTGLCALLYVAHVAYLSCWRWDYTYNMAANVVVGIVGNIVWCWYACTAYRRTGQLWRLTPLVCVAWISAAMSLELFDFAPWAGVLDAHAMWHAGTVGPTVVWWWFLVRDAREEGIRERLKR